MPTSLPLFQIASLGVAASYDELDSKLDPRPTPQSLNDLLFQKVCESIDLIAAEDSLVKLQPSGAADAKAAVLIFKPKIIAALESVIVDTNITSIGLGGTTPYYRHTSSGTHEAVNWIMADEGNGLATWEIELEVDGVKITTSVALSVFISEVSGSALPTPVPAPHHEGVHT